MQERGETPKEGGRWLLAFRFDDMNTAGDAYEVARDLIFGIDIDASVYRILLGGVPHVTVLGDGPLLQPVREMFERSCSQGEPAELPQDVIDTLFSRRSQGKIPGVFWERRGL